MRRFSLIFAALTALTLLAFLAAPLFAMRGLQAAARDGDVQGLAELIDYPAVRAGLRKNPEPEALGPAPSVLRDPLGAMRRAIEPLRPTPPSVERHLTPGGLHALAGPPQLFPAVRHWGPNRIRYAVPTPAGEARFTWRREGLLGWKLDHLGLPEMTVAPPQG